MPFEYKWMIFETDKNQRLKIWPCFGHSNTWEWWWLHAWIPSWSSCSVSRCLQGIGLIVFSLFSDTNLWGDFWAQRGSRHTKITFSRSYATKIKHSHFLNRNNQNETMIQFQLIKSLRLMNQKRMKSIRSSQRIWLREPKADDVHRFTARSLAMLWKKSKMASHWKIYGKWFPLLVEHRQFECWL